MCGGSSTTATAIPVFGPEKRHKPSCRPHLNLPVSFSRRSSTSPRHLLTKAGPPDRMPTCKTSDVLRSRGIAGSHWTLDENVGRCATGLKGETD